MDLTSMACALQQSQVISQVQTAVAQKALDVQRSQGAEAVQLVASAGGNAAQSGDPLVAEATGLGGMLDTYA